MAPPLRFTAEVPTPLAVADSERTLILQRRIGRIGIDNNNRRSAYFADSDAGDFRRRRAFGDLASACSGSQDRFYGCCSRLWLNQ